MHPLLRRRRGTLRPGSGFCVLPFHLFRALRDLIVNHLDFHCQAEIARTSLKSPEQWHPFILELFPFSLPNTSEGCHRIHLCRESPPTQNCPSVQF